jgi:VanZ family protein
VLAAVQRGLEHRGDERADLRLLRCAWPGDVENANLVLVEKGNEPRGVRINVALGSAQMKHWLIHLFRQLESQPRSAFQFGCETEDERGAAVADVPFGPLRVVRGRRFTQLILRRNRVIFGPPIARAPAAVLQAVCQREIEGGAIRTSLAAGNYRDILQNSHARCCVRARAEVKIDHLLYATATTLTMPNKTNQSALATYFQYALAGYLILLVVATHLPRNTPFLPSNFNYLDKLCHFTVYALLTLLLATTWQLASGVLTRRHLFWAWMAVAMFGAVDEITQLAVDRDCEFSDWAADALGAGVGLIVFVLLRDVVAARKSKLE